MTNQNYCILDKKIYLYPYFISVRLVDSSTLSSKRWTLCDEQLGSERCFFCKMSALPLWRTGITTGMMISSQYRRAFKRPFTVTSSVLQLWHTSIPPQIITLPPPYLSRSTMLFSSMLSPVGLHTRNLPSANWTLKRDSSVKRTRFHLRLDQRKCALAQFSLSLRWRTVNGNPT